MEQNSERQKVWGFYFFICEIDPFYHKAVEKF